MAFQFKVIKGPPMSDVPPESDAVVAKKLAELMAKLQVCLEEEAILAKPAHSILCECECEDCPVADCANGFIDDNGTLCPKCKGTGKRHRPGCGCRCDVSPRKSWQIDLVKVKLKAEMTALERKHQAQIDKYNEWIRRGRPDLK